jgi:hypothetical protein
VVIMSMLTMPVTGSIAECNVAALIKFIDSYTSYSVTCCDRRIFAKASLNLIRDSSCLGVADIVFLL